jgi:hypothetical protein
MTKVLDQIKGGGLLNKYKNKAIPRFEIDKNGGS